LILLTFSFLLLSFSYSEYSLSGYSANNYNFKLGNEVLLSEKLDLIQNKNIGIITNNSGILSDGSHIVDALHNIKDINIKKIFSPEHGFRGDDDDNDHIDKETGIPVVTLYGNKSKPSENDIQDLDILVYDIQDVAARFYTYSTTLFYCIESAYKFNKKIIICDRPIVSNPDYVDGYMIEESFKSFVGMLDVPVAYGLTCGELANFINGEYFGGKADVVISQMTGYSRKIDYKDLQLVWKKPSPNMYFPSTAVIYTGTCLLEGTNFSEGRGSDMPFEYIGAPYCDSRLLKTEMDNYKFEGIDIQEISFVPQKIEGSSISPKYNGEKCNGIYIRVLDIRKAEPFKVGIALLVSINKLFKGFKWSKGNFIDKLAGTDKLRKMINSGKTYDEIIDFYKSQLEEFKSKRKYYLIYF